MKIYTVHEPAGAPADRVDRAERLVFVRDGFSWSTLLFAPFVLLGRRLFLGFACWLVAMIGVVLVLAALDADSGWVSVAMLAVNAVFAYEVSEFERGKLARLGARMLGTVSGRNRAECERRFFETWLVGQPMVRMGTGGAAPGGQRSHWEQIEAYRGARGAIWSGLLGKAPWRRRTGGSSAPGA